MAYQAGYDKGATFSVDGGGGAVTLNITSHSWGEEVQKLVTTHSGTGGKACCIAGVLDGDGQIEANIDPTALPNATSPGIVAGAKGVIALDVGSSSDWSIHVMITRVNWRSVVNGLVTYSFNYALDNTSGTYTRPSNA